jgi:hypothetical protein
MNKQNSIKRVKSRMRDFEEAFDSLPNKKIMAVRQELMRELGWSVSVFYYKKRGDTPIWESEVPVIEEIFRRFNINAWNGQSTKPIQE